MRKTERLVTPKSFYASERDRFYNNWVIAFWRELFQNSIDAGSPNIDISLSEVKGKGSFGRDPIVEDVLRVRFSDTGCGMDERTLRDVYFRPGETTKKDGATTGGYGRARLMTCFSQVRYMIRTRDMLVEGDGPEFICSTVEEAISERQHAIEAADNSYDQERLLKELDELKSLPFYNDGCELEIDINPNEYPDRPWRNVSKRLLMDSLYEYLSQAQLYVDGTNRPLDVFINGEKWDKRLNKGRFVKQLVVTEEGGEDVKLGEVYVNKSENAPCRGQVIFRIEGAPMMSREASIPSQVIVELDKKNSRNFLTSNRDGFKGVYQSVINSFIEDIVVDNSSGLQVKDEIEHEVVSGGRGHIEVLSDIDAFDLKKLISDGAVSERTQDKVEETATRTRVGEIDFDELQKTLDPNILEKFEHLLKNNIETFLSDYDSSYWTDLFIEEVKELSLPLAFTRAPDNLKEFLVRQLSVRSLSLEEQREAETGDALRHKLHNLHIRSEEPTPTLKAVMRRYNPRNWSAEKGLGGDAAALQAAWQVCCNHAVKALMRVEPNNEELSSGKINMATGWLFKPSQKQYVGPNYVDYRVAAQYTKKNDVHVFLVNPVNDDGKKSFKLSSQKDMQKLMSLALHEAAHICSQRHDEYFSELLTKLIGVFDFQKNGKVSQDIKDAISRTRDIFKEGKTKVQETDATPEGCVRPWEALAAVSAPAASMVAGAISSPENQGYQQKRAAIAASYASCFNKDENGILEVDCDRLSKLEDTINYAEELSLTESQDLTNNSNDTLDEVENTSSFGI